MAGSLAHGKRLPEGLSIRICGDCHLGNLGPLSDAAGSAEIQIRDLDQTVIGNPAHDLIRLGLSLASAARSSDLPGVTTARMVEEMIDGYEHALRDRDEDDLGPEPEVIRTIKRFAIGRRWRHLGRERIDDTDPIIPIGKKFWAVDPDERSAIKMVDAAYWMKGCSSLGLLRYAVLIAIRGAKDREEYALVDIKAATDPIAPAAPRAAMPSDPTERVVVGARALSPHLGDRMIASHLQGTPVFIRELAPQDLKLEVDQFTQKEATKAARYLAFVVGKAHARQLDGEARAAWR